MKVLMVLTSHDKLGDTDHKTGFWVEEFAAPYYVFVDAGVEVTLASPKGGKPPMDPNSTAPDAQTEATERLENDAKAQHKLETTCTLDDVDPDDFDAIFYPGGHGPLWDLTNNEKSIKLIEQFWSKGKPVSAVCHAPAVLLNAKTPSGDPIVQGRTVTGFSNSEEAAVELTDVVPFLLEDELTAKGGHYRKVDDWQAYAVQDGMLITGQNPASSEQTAQRLLDVLRAMV
ncbi:type 1 glutamine amidotransferase domain-containing protein [Idiomarina sp. X4]|uniref:Type 1 glutamine amidotransferase domain-containing protein n=1 Tax=Idiomarina piscisalsi TaxID=1096243 RepID=A0ABM6LQ83_9GAMM|nr:MULTISPECIES: type 1 glutamine amidotransferase domain-containing protein [Idiomarina]ASG64671.1 type 1 glutamine amidotransferase domain-containing protein [Idiomarina piscisalsi]ATZ73221.1 type 1 glutamine amidotransferase domain-containing protein [Idiomarina sp. X4]MTJ02434.1 type 1 glutamine amidotransferase domain-containing protein [Idiomarina piscisalsi]RXS43520.1 type 1 glutamine amidotransferase domain-containing protein [Idiomarina sp. 29L]